MTDTMLDLKTLSTRPNAAILSIGAVKFDASKQQILSEFYVRVDPEDCERYGLHISASTVKWWMQQSEAARAEFAKPARSLPEALSQFTTWFQKEPVGITVRGNGSDFDQVILRNAYERVKMPVPWAFYNTRCYRTLRNLHPSVKGPEITGVHHNALEDAKWQALHAMKIMKPKSVADKEGIFA